MKLVLHEKIAPESRLPFNLIKGNYLLRNSKAKLYYKNFYSELNPKCIKNRCQISDVEKALNKTLSPYKINYSIEPETDAGYLGSHVSKIKISQSDYNEFLVNHVGYRLLLPIKKNTIKNKYIVFHEVRHFFDYILNPKFNLLRCGNALNNKNIDIYYKELYDVFLIKLNQVKSKKHIEKDAKKIIHKIPKPIVIDALQNIRYILMSEINSYNAELTCLLKDGRVIDYLNLKQFLLLNCKFKTKLSFIRKTLKELIGQERKEIKNSL